ncbi:putative N-acetyltransferase YxeL [Colletotrichum chlorophyti]|uniref:Putative N-acetyltransferase YxeL n=1 Tax=Colletotrichum chlorophyti TaxID=708187 RepID=A0A1Q8RT56_9PEZI|nr:putative N-acetyltransferase YxeL [Colletotrichum chlorophyti]
MTIATLQFRVATPEDAPRLQQLIEAAFRAEDPNGKWTDNLGLSARFRIGLDEVLANINNPDGATLIGTDSDGNLVASVAVFFKRNANITRLAMLSVDPNRQHGGLGRQILSYGENYCQETWGVRQLGLNALSTRQELVSWYERCGYKRTGQLSPFPVELFPDVALPDNLGFVEMEKDLAGASV